MTNHNSHDAGSNGGQAPEPEVIILDDGPNGEEASHRKEFADIASVANLRFPLRLRVLFLVLALLCVPWFVGSILCWSFLSLIHLLTFYRLSELEPLMMRFWGGMIRAAALGVGFLIAVVSPPLGLGMIMMYISLYEDSETMMAQMLRSRFTKYSK